MQQSSTLFSQINFIGYRYLSLFLFVGFVILGIIGYTLNGGFVLGTDLAGGIRIEFTAPATVEELRDLLPNPSISITTLKDANTGQSFLLTAPADLAQEGSGDYLLDAVKKSFDTNKIQILSSTFIGPSVGQDFSLQALKLISIVSLLILIYVAFRFDFIYGIGAIAASLHDILVILMVIILFKIPVDLTVTAAILTILGYSINDTIVIFDRIRENHALLPEEDMAPIINQSIAQCMVRTLLTSLTTLMVAIAIYIWAGSSLRNFGFLMIIGVISGVYSSIFVASPTTYAVWEMKRNMQNKSDKYLTK